MEAYPTRPLDLPPIGPHGVERVVEWLFWCRIVDDAFVGLLRRDTDATFSPLGAAWTCEKRRISRPFWGRGRPRAALVSDRGASPQRPDLGARSARRGRAQRRVVVASPQGAARGRREMKWYKNGLWDDINIRY